MKKLDSSLRNMVVVLVAVAMVTGGLLATVNRFTAEPIREQAAKMLAEGIRKVMGGQDVEVMSADTLHLTIDKKDATFVLHKVKGGGAAVESSTMGYGGALCVLVGFSPEGTILGYTVLQHAETPGLGAQAGEWFQSGKKGNIIGRSAAASPLIVRNDGGDVDAITASTITSRAFLKAINQAYQAFRTSEANLTTKQQ